VAVTPFPRPGLHGRGEPEGAPAAELLEAAVAVVGVTSALARDLLDVHLRAAADLLRSLPRVHLSPARHGPRPGR
jgi:hypothetical protein